MSHSKYRPPHRYNGHAPRWFTNLIIVRPERARTRQLIHQVFKLVDLEDTPEFPKGNKPNASWEWD